MTNRIFPLVLFVCLCPFFSAVAQGTEPIRNLEKPELESLLTSYVKLKMLNSTFKQVKTIQELKTELTSEGALSVIKPHDITWTVKKPSFLQVKIDDKSINITTIKDKQPLTQTLPLQNISSQQGAQGLSLLIPWLEMNVDKIMELYTIKSPSTDFLQFYPKTSSPFKSIEMNLDKKKHIRKLKFFENNSDTIEIHFTNVKIQAT